MYKEWIYTNWAQAPTRSLKCSPKFGQASKV